MVIKFLRHVDTSWKHQDSSEDILKYILSSRLVLKFCIQAFLCFASYCFKCFEEPKIFSRRLTISSGFVSKKFVLRQISYILSHTVCLKTWYEFVLRHSCLLDISLGMCQDVWRRVKTLMIIHYVRRISSMMYIRVHG